MITTEKMVHVTGVILEDDLSKVTQALLALGILDFVNIRDISPHLRDKLRTLPPPLPTARISELIRKIDTLLHLAEADFSGSQGDSIDFIPSGKVEEIEKEILDLAGRIDGFQREVDRISGERRQMEEMKRQIGMFGSLQSGMKAQSDYSFLAIRTGSVPAEAHDALSQALDSLPSVLIPLEGSEPSVPAFILITMKQDEQRIRGLLDHYRWSESELPPGYGQGRSEPEGAIAEKLSLLYRREETMRGDIQTEILEAVPRLRELRSILAVNRLACRIQSTFSRTERTVLFSGWLPLQERGSLQERVEEVTAGRCYIEWSSEKELEEEHLSPPVKLSNPRLLKPFEQLVKNYSIPEYGTVDPTPFVAASYFIMFGLMFGDAGHGLVLLLIGILGSLLRGRRKKGATLFRLITWCGVSAILSGILFGSVFGFAVFPPVWFSFHEAVQGTAHTGPVTSIFGILKITIYFGIGVIGTGLILNWINLCLKKRWFPLIFDKGGIIGGWLYGAGVYLAFYFVRHDYRELPPASFILPAIILPLVFLILKPVLEFRIHPKPFTALTPVVFLMEWIVEVLEISSGYLANTLSFMRVAGLGIAHVSLMSAFFQMAGMASPDGGYGHIGSVLILLLGNALVIGLEGLSAGIQALRLNYYEFFSKYFTGSGREYIPISLDNEG